VRVRACTSRYLDSEIHDTMVSMRRLGIIALPRCFALVAASSVLRLSLCVVTNVGAAPGQLVETGRSNPHACEEVKVHPNLTLSAPTRVDGHVEDSSGAAMAHTRLELRTYTSELKQTFLKRAETDANGGFSLGATPAGRYRVVVFAPGFRQATDLKCSKNCTLSIRLVVAPTDTFPESVCPPR
jgi:hypothetical protein